MVEALKLASETIASIVCTDTVKGVDAGCGGGWGVGPGASAPPASLAMFWDYELWNINYSKLIKIVLNSTQA